MKSRNQMFLALFLIVPALVLAQTGTITGTVTDATGAVVQGAKVKATNLATNASATATTSATGNYTMPNLPVGTYTVDIEKQGFKNVKFDKVGVSVALVLPLNAQFQVGSTQETVTVTSETAAPIETESTQVSTLIDSARMKALPLITRNPYELVLLSPGTSQSNANGGFNVNGSRDRNNNFLLDGVDNNDTSVPGIAGGVLTANPESSEEFRIITNNFNAEYGRNTGAIIDVVTKSGTNSIHADAYWFGRYNKIGGARDWFNPATGPNGGPQNPYVRNQFGGSFGGPIWKNKTFFFINTEWDRFPTTQTGNTLTPAPEFLTGKFTWHTSGIDAVTHAAVPFDVPIDLTPGSLQNLFFAGAVFGSSAQPGFDPTIQKVLAKYPVPVLLNADGYSGTSFFPNSSNTKSYNSVAKIDHHFSDREALSVRYGYGRTTDPNPFFDASLPNNVGAFGFNGLAEGISGNLTSTLSSTLINSFTAGWNRIKADFACGGLNTLNDPYPVDQFGHGTEFIIGPFNPFACARGTSLADSQGRTTSTTSFADTLTWIKGAHNWKFGAEFRNVHEAGNSNFGQRRQVAVNAGTAFQGFDLINVTSSFPSNVDPNTVAGLIPLMDAVSTWYGLSIGDNQSQFFNKDGTRRGDDNKFYVQREYGFYAQDSWKLRRNFTLNLGLRYQFNGVPYEKNGDQSNLFTDPKSLPAVFERTGPGTGRLFFNNDFSNIEPRIGFSWDPRGDGKTAIRASFGIFHDRTFGNLFGNARGNPPFQGTYNVQPFDTIGNALFDSGFFPAQPPSLPFTANIPDGSLQAPAIFPRNFRNSSVNSWFLGVQHELPGDIVVDLTYVGNQGHYIFRDVDPNPPQPELVAQLVAFCSVPNAFNCTPATVSGRGNLYSGGDNGTLPFNAVAHNAIGRGSVFSAVLVASNANANYNSLQAKITKRMKHGVQIQGAYTWSHSIDDSNDPIVAAGAGVNFARNPLNPGQDRGNSDHDIRQVGVINYVWELPFGRGKSFASSGIIGRVLEGFQFSGIATMQSGRAFDIFGNVDSQRVGRVGRPDVTGNPFGPTPPTTSLPPGTKIFFTNPGAITDLTPDQFGRAGNLRRNFFHGPNFFNSDLALAKKTRLTERFSLETRLEVFNLLNHPNFRTPGEIDFLGNVVGSALFGAISATVGNPDGTTGARQLQMGAKLVF